MKHLGERVTTLVDDQLEHDARDLALAHLATCAGCRTDVERERAIKATLRGLRDVVPSTEFVATLLALAEPGGPLPPERRSFPGTATPAAGWRPGSARPAGVSGGRRPAQPGTLRRRTGVRLAVGGAVSVGALTVVLASLGGPDTPAPVSVVPPMQQFTVEHARSTGSMPFSDPAWVVVPAPDGQGPGQ